MSLDANGEDKYRGPKYKLRSLIRQWYFFKHKSYPRAEEMKMLMENPPQELIEKGKIILVF